VRYGFHFKCLELYTELYTRLSLVKLQGNLEIVCKSLNSWFDIVSSGNLIDCMAIDILSNDNCVELGLQAGD
jgi:hypothetical protein